MLIIYKNMEKYYNFFIYEDDFKITYKDKDIREYKNSYELFIQFLQVYQPDIYYVCKVVPVYLDLFNKALIKNKADLIMIGDISEWIFYVCERLSILINKDVEIDIDNAFMFVYIAMSTDETDSKINAKYLLRKLLNLKQVTMLPKYLMNEEKIVQFLTTDISLLNVYDKFKVHLTYQQERDMICEYYKYNQPIDIKVQYKENEKLYNTYNFLVHLQ